MEKIGPFGIGSPQPVFAINDAHISGARRMGVNHLRFTAEDATGRINCVAWRCADEPMGEAILCGEKLHLVGRIKADEWQGRRRLQFEAPDAAPA
jgi:single-stranded-DNA-specific exonuclease